MKNTQGLLKRGLLRRMMEDLYNVFCTQKFLNEFTSFFMTQPGALRLLESFLGQKVSKTFWPSKESILH